jgi:hypothetical protein
MAPCERRPERQLPFPPIAATHERLTQRHMQQLTDAGMMGRDQRARETHLNRSEPLFRSANDDGLLAAPVVWVAVLVLFAVKEGVFTPQ